MKYLCAIYLLIISLSVNAQEQAIDSLKKALYSATDHSVRTQNMIEIGKIYFEREPDSAQYYVRNALVLSQKFNDRQRESDCLSIIGNLLVISENYPQALDTLIKALKIREELKNEEGMGKSYVNIARVYTEMKEYELAMKEYFKAKPIFEKIIKQPGSGTTLSKDQSKKLTENKRYLSTTLLNIGDNYERSGKLDSAMAFQKQANFLAQEVHDSVNISFSLINLGSIYFKLGYPESALKHYQESLIYLLAIDDKQALSIANHGLAEVYKSKGQVDSAIHYARTALYLADVDDYKNERYSADTLLSKLFKSIKRNDSALYYFELAAYESSEEIKQLRQVLRMNYLEQIREHETENDKVNKENKLKISARNRQLAVLFSLTLLLLLAAIIIFRYYKIAKRSKDKIELLQRELHHRVKNNLAVISRLIEVAAKETVSNLPLTELENQVSSIAFVHEQLTGENDITQLQMQAFLEKLMQHINQSMAEGISIVYEIDAPVLIPANKATPLALIINELATNSIKYAFEKNERKRIQIKMSQSSGNYYLLYNDNGCGRAEDAKPGYGSKLIRGLSSQLNGKMKLWNDNGYNFELIIPV